MLPKSVSETCIGMFLEVLSALSRSRHSANIWHHPSVPCSSFRSPLFQFLSFSAVLLHSFFSDTKFCICQCINRTRTVKIFCLAARLGSSNQLGLEVMMGWRRQPRPSVYKCSHGPKIFLATPAPSDSGCLNYCVFQCASAGLLCLPHTSQVNGDSRVFSVVLTKHLLTLGPEGEQQGYKRGGSQISGEHTLWISMSVLRHKIGEELQKCMDFWTDFCGYGQSSQKIEKVAFLAQLHLQSVQLLQ